LLTCSDRFIPDDSTWIVWDTISNNLINCDGHITTIRKPTSSFTSIIYISSIIVPRFPRIVFDVLFNLNSSTNKIPHIILRFKISTLKWILSAMSSCDEWCYIHRGTLTTNTVSVSVSDIWTLQYLDCLVCHRTRTISNRISSSGYAANIFSKNLNRGKD